MDEASSVSDPNDEVLARFIQELEASQDSEAVVAKYAATYPHLAEEVRALAAMRQRMPGAEPPAGAAGPGCLSEFRLVRQVARGGMGEVYEAWHERLHRRVAVKIIRQGRVSPANRERFLREQDVLARLHQTHIVPIHTAGDEGEMQYFAMPFIEGAALHNILRTAQQLEASTARKMPTLARLASRAIGDPDRASVAVPRSAPEADPNLATRDESGAPPPERPAGRLEAVLSLSREYFRSVAEAMADVAEAIQHAHDAEIIHRDLKPSNIMVDTAGQCWLIDFGLAGYLNKDSTPEVGACAVDPSRPPLLASGIFGTAPYMAPEQFEGRADARTDVWGLGTVLYELLTLRQPFGGEPRESLIRRISSADPSPPRSLVTNVPLDLAAICGKALRKQPGQRYQTGREFAEDLRRWLRGQPTRARPAWWPRRFLLWARREKELAAALGIALFVALAFIGAAFAWEQERLQALRQKNYDQQQEALRQKQHEERQALVHQLGRFWLVPHHARWSKEAEELVDRIAALGRDEALRDQAAASLVGLEAFPSKVFKETLASAVALDATGDKLLIGGAGKDDARIWDGTADKVTRSGQPKPGPVAFHADGTPVQLVPDPNNPRALLLWDMAGRRPLREFTLPAKRQPAPGKSQDWPVLVLTSDGSTVAAVADEDGPIAVWDAGTGKLIKEFPGKVGAVALSPDGHRLANGSEDGTITVWELPSGEKVASLRENSAPIRCLAFAPDPWRPAGKRQPAARRNWLLASGEAGGRVAVWDVSARVNRTICYGAGFGIDALAFSPDGTLLAGAVPSQALLWDVATGRVLLTFGNLRQCIDVTFSADGRRLAFSSRDSYDGKTSASVWDLHLGRGLRQLHGLSGQVARVASSRDGRFLAALSHSWQVGVWDQRSGRLMYVFDAPVGVTADNGSLAFDPEATRLACVTGRGARLWDLGTGEEVRSWDLPPGLADTLAFHPSGKLLLCRADSQGRGQPLICRVYELRRGGALPLYEKKEFGRYIFTAVATPDGKYFAADFLDHRPGPDPHHTDVLFDALSGEKLWDLPLQSTLRFGALGVDSAGKLLAVIDHDDKAYRTMLVEIPTGKLLCTPEAPSTALGPDGALVLRVPDSGSGFSLFREGEKAPVVTLGTESPTSSPPVFDAFGSHTAWGNADGTVTVCDIQEVRRGLTRMGWGW